MKKIYQKIIFCSIILLGSGILSAKTYAQSIIKGKLTDGQNNLLPGVSVIPAKGAGTVTGANGTYTLKLPDGAHTITFSIVVIKK